LDSKGTLKRALSAADSGFEPLPADMTEDVKKRTIEFRSLPDFDMKGLFFTLWRTPGISELYFKTSACARYFIWSTYLPAPSDDLLLYLCLAGSILAFVCLSALVQKMSRHEYLQVTC
jgi:hypothetical protein